MGVLLDVVYAVLLAAASPIWLYRMLRHGRYRRDVAQRLGAVPRRYSRQPAIWVHGVSLGEINACRTLVRELHSQLPDYQVVVSTSTDTGMEAAQRHFGADHVVFRWPLDFSMAVRRALGRMRPSAVVLMEGEVWPNFLAACRRRGIAAVVVNGRISADKGYPRYRMLGPLARRLFNALTAVGAQDERYAGCYRKLGVEPAKVHVTGMIKFDSAQVASHIDGQEALAAAIGLSPGERLLVAGGTGPGEEDVLLEIYRRLKVNHPSLRLAVVPRKPERFDEVARKLSQDGGNVVRRSQCPDGSTAAAEPGAVVVGDTMGELRKFYALAEVVFVGRSLAPMGGSDMIESAALGKPTCFGPHTFNFPQAKELAARGCRQVCDAAELERVLDEWLGDPAGAARQGAAAQEFVRSQQGSCRRNVEMICGVLGRQPSVPGAIATPKPD